MGGEVYAKRGQSGEARTLTHIAFIVKEVRIAEAISLMKQVVNISEEIHDPMLEEYRNILENFQQLIWPSAHYNQ